MKLIPLTQGKFAQVDDTDYEYLSQFNWYVWNNGGRFYARRYSNGKTIFMHREILNIQSADLYADHKDHNCLNNQRSNLRIATKTENNKNKTSHKNSASKYLGVSKCNKGWRARITVDGENKHLGVFLLEKDAALAYDEAAIVIHGEFANLNII